MSDPFDMNYNQVEDLLRFVYVQLDDWHDVAPIFEENPRLFWVYLQNVMDYNGLLEMHPVQVMAIDMRYHPHDPHTMLRFVVLVEENHLEVLENRYREHPNITDDAVCALDEWQYNEDISYDGFPYGSKKRLFLTLVEDDGMDFQRALEFMGWHVGDWAVEMENDHDFTVAARKADGLRGTRS